MSVDTFLADVRYALRGLRRNPGFTVVAVATLALGIGTTTAVFSAVKPVLFEPLPYPDADRLAVVWDYAADGAPLEVTFGSYRELVLRSRTLETVAVSKPWQPTLTGDHEPERLDGQRVSASYFRTLGVRPAVGRDLGDDDDRPHAPSVVIISDGLWRRRFGADRSIVGRQVRIDDVPMTIVGIMPARFENVPRENAELWAPLQYDPALPIDGREWGHHLRAFARLRKGVGFVAAAADLDDIARHPVPDHLRAPWSAMRRGLLVRALDADMTRAVRPALVAVFMAAALVLSIACVNVANLFLARLTRRRGELATRAALGATTGRLLRQTLTEACLLSGAGGLAGVLVAHAGIAALIARSPLRLPRFEAVAVDSRALAFAFLAAAVVGIVIGVVATLNTTDHRLPGVMGTSRTIARGPHRTRGVLVVVEVALAVVLLVASGLLLRSVQRLLSVDVGFDTSGLLTLQIQASGDAFASQDATDRFFDRALDAVRHLPGVAAAGFTSQLPLSGDSEKYGTQFESSPTERLDNDHSALRYAVSGGYVETLGIPLRQGRLFTERDRTGTPPVALISEHFARRRFPGISALGQRLHLGRTDVPWISIVGVVGDVRHTSLALEPADAVYIPASQWYATDRARTLVIRTAGEASALADPVRRAIWSVDPNQPITRVATMQSLVAATAAERRFALMLFELFAATALVLAAIGIYGLLSGSVAERLREIGVRAALGASRGDILRMIVQGGMTMMAAGLALGLVAAGLASQALIAMLFDVSPLDPATYGVVVGLLTTVAAMACGVPAWRAMRVDPAVALRAE